MSGSDARTAWGHSCAIRGEDASCGVHYTSAPTPCEDTLTEKQRRFVEAYMGQAAGNGTMAAKIAGYSEKNAHAEASRLLRNAKVRDAIQARQAADPLVMTREMVLRQLSAVGMGNYVVPLRDRTTGLPLTGPDGRELKGPAPLSMQIKAMELLAKMCGWFKEPEDGNDRFQRFLSALEGARESAR